MQLARHRVPSTRMHAPLVARMQAKVSAKLAWRPNILPLDSRKHWTIGRDSLFMPAISQLMAFAMLCSFLRDLECRVIG